MTSPVDIRPDHLAIVQGILREHLPVGVKVWVFGSRANWTTKDSSDLDLALEGESKLGHKVLGALKDAFEDSALPYTVDVVDLNRIGDSFRQIVKSQRAPLPIDGDGTAAGDWIQCTVAEACGSINYGLTASASSRSDGPKFLRITDIVSGQIDWNTVPHVEADDDTVAKYRLHDGDIVIARTGASTGTSAYVSNPPPSVFASYLVRLQAKPEFDARFLACYLKSREFWDFIHGVLGDKSAQPNASASTMTAAPFRAPRDEAEQRAIAHILCTLDDKIELNRRMNETLEAMARALFKSWFVDFDPVRAKMEGRWRRGESLAGLPADLYDLFPDRLVDSELGEIPDGWEVKALGEVLRSTNERVGDQLVAEYACTTDGLVPRAEMFMKRLSRSAAKNKIMRRNQLVFGLSRRVLNFGLMKDDIGCVSPVYRTYSVDEDVLLPELLEAAMRANPDYFYLAVSSSSREGQSVSEQALFSLEVVVPERSVQHTLHRMIQDFSKHSARMSKESLLLANQRDALLPRLVSGELRLGNS